MVQAKPYLTIAHVHSFPLFASRNNATRCPFSCLPVDTAAEKTLSQLAWIDDVGGTGLSFPQSETKALMASMQKHLARYPVRFGKEVKNCSRLHERFANSLGEPVGSREELMQGV